MPNDLLPDYVVLADPSLLPLPVGGFPHRIALLPGETTLEMVRAERGFIATFLVEPDCSDEALNSRALTEYLDRRIAVLVYARRARELRPFLRREDRFKARGYTLTVLL
ncbi:MAG: hypothetical protein JO110_17640 [Acetobacteraceae bacterium]|nr:hypothetical protein [Acetobacteraceae bacterium]